MVHNNQALIEGGFLLVDRKFHDGLSFMANQLNERVVTANPRWSGQSPIMDMVKIPLSELPYAVVILDVDERGSLTEQARGVLESEIGKAGLVIGQSFHTGEMARRLNVPYVALVEYDLQTQLVAGTAELTSPLRKVVRSFRIFLDYHTRQKSDLQGALAVHCNGYPIYQAASAINEDPMLYLDSRLSSSSVITRSQLESRLSRSDNRPLRLLYSGRFSAMKGVLDVVRVAIECQRQQIDIELSLYGQGEESNQIEALVGSAPHPEKIQVHDPVEFPTLLEIAKGFDVFVCCHLQSDPSCTYIESLGAGLPVVGYGNRMWTALQAHSQAGSVSRMKDINGLVSSIAELAADRGKLAMLSRNAREFAAAHSFEAETDKRVASMNAALLRLSHPKDSAHGQH